MILVLLGTQNNSFHRLLEEIQKCIDNGIINEEVVVQAGGTKFESKDMQIFELIPYEDLEKLIDKADVIITHGGVGSIIMCLKKKKKVIAVPRLSKYGEHVNDHQAQIIETFDSQGFIKGIKEVEELDKTLQELDKFEPTRFEGSNGKIIEIISNFIDKKKILFAAYSLEIGGIEKSLVELLNYICELGCYDITLVLEKKEGDFLKDLNDKVHVIEYRPSKYKNLYIRKLINLWKRIKFMLKNYNKFDFSVAYATYSLPASFIARVASSNSALWVHTNYLTLFDGDKSKVEEFFNERDYSKFKNIIFVSEDSKNAFLSVFQNVKSNITVCGHYLKYSSIIKKAEEQIEDLDIDSALPTFVNIGRHSEKEKRLSRLLEATHKLKMEGYKFNLLLVGDGPDKASYEEIVEKYNLQKTVKILGKKSNPYPYYKIANCVVLTSDYEGFPVVFLESEIFNKPIITTKVSDYQMIENKYGIVVEKDEESVYKAMKKFIENGYEIKEKFDAEKYNKEVLKKLERIFNKEI